MTMTNTEDANWYQIADIDAIDTPALLVFVERVQHNIATALQMVGNPARLRPHVKTHKCSEVVNMMMAAGITQFKCATIAEAEMLGMCKAPDVLMAYQPTGPKLNRFIALIKKYPATQFGCLTDNIDSATEQSASFAKEGLNIPVYIDVNVGMNRTGIIPGPALVDLYTQIAALPGLQLQGLHAYDGHIRQSDFAAKKVACDEAFNMVEQMADQIERAGHSTPKLIMGGSPAFSVHCHRYNVVCSPGTFVYWDYGYQTLCPEQQFLPAAVLLTRVISLPTPTRICLDLGHKSVAAENDISKRVHFLQATHLTPVGQSEEHLVVETQENHGYKPGDILYAIPYHVCPTVALYERVITIKENRVSGEWKNISRDRKINC